MLSNGHKWPLRLGKPLVFEDIVEKLQTTWLSTSTLLGTLRWLSIIYSIAPRNLEVNDYTHRWENNSFFKNEACLRYRLFRYFM